MVGILFCSGKVVIVYLLTDRNYVQDTAVP